MTADPSITTDADVPGDDGDTTATSTSTSTSTAEAAARLAPPARG